MAFNFPDPTLQQTVTNDETGVTYQWKEPPGKWVVVTRPVEDSGVEDLSNRVDTLEIDNRAIKSDVQSHEVAIQTLQSQPAAKDYMIGTDKNITRIAEPRSRPAIELVDSELNYSNVLFEATGGISVTSTPSSIVIDGSNVNGNVNLDNYYTKQEIDNQFALRGVGLLYLISNFNGTAASRPGEYNTDNRIFGQITKISLAPVDEQGKNARQAAIGDTIELYDQTVEKYYRYQITAVILPGSYSVSYVGLEGDRDDTMGIGNPFLIYLYPTHISASQINGAIATLTETQNALAVEVDHNEEQLQAMSTAVFIAQSKINNLEGLDIQNALSALASALQDIIELKSKVSSLEQKVFLILE